MFFCCFPIAVLMNSRTEEHFRKRRKTRGLEKISKGLLRGRRRQMTLFRWISPALLSYNANFIAEKENLISFDAAKAFWARIDSEAFLLILMIPVPPSLHRHRRISPARSPHDNFHFCFCLIIISAIKIRKLRKW